MTARPFKVRGFSTHWNDYVGASFATRPAAEQRALQMASDGYYSVELWENDTTGCVKGAIDRVVMNQNGTVGIVSGYAIYD